MRLTLLGMNTIALGALSVPAYLIFESATKVQPIAEATRYAYLGALALGALCLWAAMNRLSARKHEPGPAMSLMLLGTGLFATPLVLLLLS